jgi:MoaA/NifB/PqqE/SkfB family radical SAM enzyme
MCTCWEVPRTRRETRYYLDSLDRLLELHPAAVRFTGGEPLLLPGLARLVRRAADTGARVSVITNGRLLRSKAAALADAGCVEVVLSLDGAGAVHDRIRATKGLFSHCLSGIEALAATPMSYGVNTVLQQEGVGSLEELAGLLLAQRRRPTWWHLIPVRDYPALEPDEQARTVLARVLPEIRELMAAEGVRVVVDEAMFAGARPRPCQVPQFTAYAAADTGDLYGCNMLSHRDLSLGDYHAGSPWPGEPARELRERCRTGTNSPCGNCDRGSQAMNFLLRDLARAHHGDPARLR